jgi:hypothetical protein
MSNVNSLITLIKSNLEVDLIPVAIGALQILEKNPNILGIDAAEAYILGNAPAALLSSETSLLQQVIASLTAKLLAMQTGATAPTPVPPVVPPLAARGLTG